MNILEKIEFAFAARQRPDVCVAVEPPRTDVYQDAHHFQGMNWRELNCTSLATHSACVFGFTPDAFCYYLPGIYASGIRENRANLEVNSSLLSMLDRSNTPKTWDDFFVERWTLLNEPEILATKDWVCWVFDAGNGVIDSNQRRRSLETLTLLSHRRNATPLAWKNSR